MTRKESISKTCHCSLKLHSLLNPTQSSIHFQNQRLCICRYGGLSLKVLSKNTCWCANVISTTPGYGWLYSQTYWITKCLVSNSCVITFTWGFISQPINDAHLIRALPSDQSAAVFRNYNCTRDSARYAAESIQCKATEQRSHILYVHEDFAHMVFSHSSKIHNHKKWNPYRKIWVIL